MWQRLITILVAMACLCILVDSQSDSQIYQMTEKRSNRYCGRFLADMLSVMCKGMYNTKFHKKSYPADSDSDEDYAYQQQQYLDDTRFPFRSRASATALIPGSFRRFARGVHDECCKKPCTRAELLSYCAN